MRSVGACLDAADLVDPRELVPAAVDELERIIGAAYRPGAGLARNLRAPEDERGDAGTHVRVSAALLSAYACTGRLPYSMLAEELMQFAQRHLADDRSFVLDCEAARVLIRLAALHDAREYRDAAVLAPGVDYAADAARLLSALEPAFREYGVGAAVFGLALTEWPHRS